MRSGTRIDRYELVAPLGEGGQGAVWKATDVLHGQPRAIKLIEVDDTRPAQLERARREARALAALTHPSLVRCHGLFEDLGKNVMGVVLDLVDGTTLSDALLRLNAAQRAWVARHIAGALAYLHAQRIVHRDLKPDNVLLADGFWSAPHAPEHVKLVDFGIAVPDSNPRPLTAEGFVVGTSAYMAPELLDPMRFGGGLPTPAADVFAFGVILWQLLGGEHPSGLGLGAHVRDYLEEYRRVAAEGAPWSSRVPVGAWRALVEECLALHTSRRLGDGSALELRLREIAEPMPQLEGSATMVSPGAPRPTAADTSAPHVISGTAAINPPAAPIATAPLTHAPQVFREAQHSAPAPSQSSLNASRSLLLVAIGAILGAGALALLGGGAWWWFVAGDEPPAPLPTRAAAPTAPETELEAPETEALAPRPAPRTAATFTCPVINGKICGSGNDCGGDCTAVIDAQTRFELRFGGAATTGADGKAEDLLCSQPRGELCFKIIGSLSEPKCTPLASIRNNVVADQALTVQAFELILHGLDVTLRDGPNGRVLASGKARVGGVDRSALCRGLIFMPPKLQLTGEVGVRYLAFFLDDPEDPPPRRCGQPGRCGG